MKRTIIASIVSVVVTFAASSFIFHDSRPAPAIEWETQELPMPDQIVWGAWLERVTRNGEYRLEWCIREVVRIDQSGTDPDSPIVDKYFLASGEGYKLEPFPRPKAWCRTFPQKMPW